MNVRRFLTAGLLLGAAAVADRAGAAAVPRVEIAIVSGTPQTVRAYVAPRDFPYQAQFAPLVVRVGRDTLVRFRLTTPGCDFPEQIFENDKDVHRVKDANAYDVQSVKGVAQIKLMVSTQRGAANMTVVAQPTGKTTGAAVTFHLIAL